MTMTMHGHPKGGEERHISSTLLCGIGGPKPRLNARFEFFLNLTDDESVMLLCRVIQRCCVRARVGGLLCAAAAARRRGGRAMLRAAAAALASSAATSRGKPPPRQ